MMKNKYLNCYQDPKCKTYFGLILKSNYHGKLHLLESFIWIIGMYFRLMEFIKSDSIKIQGFYFLSYLLIRKFHLNFQILENSLRFKP